MGELWRSAGEWTELIINEIVHFIYRSVWFVFGGEQNLKSIACTISTFFTDHVFVAGAVLSGLISFFVVFVKGLKNLHNDTVEHLSVAFEIGLGTIISLLLIEIYYLKTYCSVAQSIQFDGLAIKATLTPILVVWLLISLFRQSLKIRSRGYFPRFHPEQSFPERYERELRPVRGMLAPNFYAYFKLTVALLWLISDLRING